MRASTTEASSIVSGSRGTHVTPNSSSNCSRSSNTAAGHQEERVHQATDHRGARLCGVAASPVTDLMQVLGDWWSSCGHPRVTTTASPPQNQSLTKHHNHQENTQGLVKMVLQKSSRTFGKRKCAWVNQRKRKIY